MKKFTLLTGIIFALSSYMISAQNAPVTTAPHMLAAPGTNITVPITVEDFINIGALSLTLYHDADVLTYTGFTNTSGFPALTADGFPGVVLIGGMTDPFAPGITLADHTVLMYLHFDYAGGFSALNWDIVDFYACEYSGPGPDFNQLNDNPKADYYIFGSIAPFGTGPVTTITDVMACIDTEVCIPVKVSDFTNVGALSLKLDFDPAALTYLSFVNNSAFPDLQVNQPVSGTLTIGGYSAAAGITFPDETTLLTLCFQYHGGNTTVEWNNDDDYSLEYTDWPDYNMLITEPQEDFYIDGEVLFIGAFDVDIAAVGDISTIANAPVIIPVTVTYPDLLAQGTDPAVLTDARISTSLIGGFPAGTRIFDITYNGTSVLAAPVVIGGQSEILLSTLLGTVNSLLGHSGQTVNWKIYADGVDSPVVIPVQIEALAYIDLLVCETVLDTENFDVSFTSSSLTLITPPPVIICYPDGIASFVLTLNHESINPVSGEIRSNATIVSDKILPAGTIIYWKYNYTGEPSVPNGSLTLTSATNTLYLSEVVTGVQGNLISPNFLGHTGDISWKFDVAGLDPGTYNFVIKAAAQLSGYPLWEYTTMAPALSIVVNTPPEITFCPPTVNVFNDVDFCGAIVNFSEAVVIGTPTPVVTYTLESTPVLPGHFFPVGTSTVVVTAVNDCGTDNCIFVVNVTDNQPPVWDQPALPQNITVECDAVPTPAVLTATDNCDPITVQYAEVRTDGSCPYNYILTRTWTATDNSNNSIVHTQIITVQDTQPPQLLGADNCSLLDQQPDWCVADFNAFDATGLEPQVAGLYTDNCGTVTATLFSSSVVGTCQPVGTYIFEIEDECGNAVFCTVTYTSVRTTPPAEVGGPVATSGNIECADQAIPPGAPGGPVLPVVEDACGIVLFPVGYNTGGNYDGCEGTIFHQYTYTDCAMLSFVWTYTYTVDRITPPTVTLTAPSSGVINCASEAIAPHLIVENYAESFDNFMHTGTAYLDGSFIGDEGITWNYYHSRNEDVYGITGKGLMLRNGRDSKLESATIPDGIGSLNVQMRKAFTGNSPRQLELWINGQLIATSITFGGFTGADPTVYDFTVNDINIPGDVVIMIKPSGNTTTNRQVTIDNLTWTSYNLPAVEDVCGNSLTWTGPVQGGTYNGCDGTIVYTYRFTDCSGLFYDWDYTYTIEREDFTMPADDGETIECVSQLYFPAPPAVTDYCGVDIVPAGPELGIIPECEGVVTMVWTYTDCAGFSHDWTYSFNVERSTAPVQIGTPVTNESNVACQADAVAPHLNFITYVDNLNTFNHTGTPYSDGSFTGVNDVLWNYYHCRNNQTGDASAYVIDGMGIVFRASQSSVIADISGGIGSFSVKMRKAYTGSGDRQLGLWINGQLIQKSITFGGASGADPTIHIFTVENINIPGDFTIKIAPTTGGVGTNRQITIDDISWTSYNLPFVQDVCGARLDWTGPVQGGTFDGCEGTITYAYSFKDCANLEYLWTYTYNADDNLPPSLVGIIPDGATAMNLCFDEIPAGPSVADIQALYIDNCGTVTVTKSGVPAGDDCSWEVTYIYTIVDACENYADPVSIVYSGGDTEDPQWAQPMPDNVTVACDNIPSVPSITASDNCDDDVEVVFNEVRTDGSCDYNYTLTRTWTASDNCGHSIVHEQVITVQDILAPELIGIIPDGETGMNLCFDAIPAGPGTDDIKVLYSDNCGEVVVSKSGSPTGDDCNWSVTYEYQIADECGNTATPVFITYSGGDAEDPQWAQAMPANVTVACDDVPVVPSIAATDNCDDDVEVSLSEIRTDGSCDYNYTLTRTWTANDNCGRSIVHEQVIIVQDILAPELIGIIPDGETGMNLCFDAIPAGPGTGDIKALYADNCGEVIVTKSGTPTGNDCNWAVTYEYEISDECGNAATTVFISYSGGDAEDPQWAQAMPADVTVACDDVPGVPSITATDNCDTDVEISFDEFRTDGSCDYNYTLTRTWLATDNCSRSITHIQMITVEDTEAPTLTCPPNISVSTDLGEDYATVDVGTATAFDNCGSVNVFGVRSDMLPLTDPYPLGTTLITWTAIDECGLHSQCEQSINVYEGNLLQLNVFLQGPYDAFTGEMNTTLNLNGQLSVNQPFNTDPWNYAGTETLPSPLPADIVEWVLIEIRSNKDVSSPATRRAGLLYKDGTVAVSFQGIAVDDVPYYVVVFHRNHMPVMSATGFEIPDTGATFDLTIINNVYMGGAILLNDIPDPDVYGMIAGDVTHNGILKYSGPGNDRAELVSQIIFEGFDLLPPFATNGYWFADVDLDNQLTYSVIPNNDRARIIQNVGVMTGSPLLTAFYESVVPETVFEYLKNQNEGPVNIYLDSSEEGIAIILSTDRNIHHGLIDNIQFTLAWNSNDKETEQLIAGYTSLFNLTAQGGAYTMDGISYQIFATAIPTTLPSLWSNEELTIMTFEGIAGSDLAKRLWIADNDLVKQNNSMYYVSVWGKDHTGMIKTNTVSVEEPAAEESVTLYPNPVNNGKLFVEFNGTLTQVTARIEIFDMQNRLVSVNNTSIPDNQKLLLDVSSLQPGIYMLHLINNKMIYQEKFVVIRK